MFRGGNQTPGVLYKVVKYFTKLLSINCAPWAISDGQMKQLVGFAMIDSHANQMFRL